MIISTYSRSIINVMKICLISAYHGRISRARVPLRPHYGFTNTFTSLPLMVNLYKGIRIPGDQR